MRTDEDITTWADQLEPLLEGTPFDRVMIVDEVLSTQDTAARACVGRSKNHPGTIIIASKQLMGRGQRANNWYDAPGMTLPCSLAIGPECLGFDNANLAARAGLAALQAIQRAVPDQPFTINWPNDIYCAHTSTPKKVAGVLIEHAQSSVVIGIGINCTQAHTDFDPSIAGSAISLRQLGATITRIDLARLLIESLNHWLSVATDEQVIAYWEQHDGLLDTTRKMVSDNQPYFGKVIRIDPLNTITMRTDDGDITLPVTQTRLIND